MFACMAASAAAALSPSLPTLSLAKTPQAAAASLDRGKPLGGSAMGGKLGLCCEECTSSHYGPFANVSSWVYRYSLFVDDASAAKWLAANNVEFVAHLAHKKVPLPDGSACTFNASDAGNKVPLCTAAMLDGALAAKNNKGLTIKYIMGWNEAYDHSNSKAKKKYIAPVDAATWWRTFVQGLAARNGNLSLVSPTTGVTKGKLEWLGDMILACWSQRSKGCDVETIAAFSVHDYKCSESYWRTNYGPNGTFQTNLKAHLAEGAGNKDWSTYVDSRPIWVTETNCNGDYGFPPSAFVSRSEQCARIAGQRAESSCGDYGKCGMGSIAAMESMDTVGRVSWWNTHQKNKNNATKAYNAMLVSATGDLFPAGNALVNGLQKSTDCSGGALSTDFYRSDVYA